MYTRSKINAEKKICLLKIHTKHIQITSEIL